jgi:hypothetical protein
MIDFARAKVPDITAEVGDAADIDSHFPGQSFDLISTHFITGFVPMSELAPKIRSRLDEGGCWSFVGGTRAGFPALQARANSKLMRWVYGGKSFSLDSVTCNPAGRDEVKQTLEQHGFEVLRSDTFEPQLHFKNLNEFMDFAYRGGWLTPFIEALGLHKAGFMARLMLNTMFFPVDDHHSIEIHLARKAH